MIPPEFHSTTPVTICATAGMRLLDVELRTSVYDKLFEDLKAEPGFSFDSLRREDIYTLDGGEEGFFGAISINSLLDNIGADLGVLPGRSPMGALDMGGGSTQIMLPDRDPGGRLSERDFYIKSYLGFGADAFRERVMDRCAA